MNYSSFLKEENSIREKIKEKNLSFFKERLLEVQKIFEKESVLLTFSDDRIKTLIIGDTHGDIITTKLAVKRYFETDAERLVFLGDYVDRGVEDILNLHLVLFLKIHSPGSIILLRGNHETPDTNSWYGFKDHLKECGQEELIPLYDSIFAELPLALQIKDTLLIHGGLAEGLTSLEQLATLPKEIKPANMITQELLWNDPHKDAKGFLKSFMRGGNTKVFGEEAIIPFLKANSLKRIIRAHEPIKEGFQDLFGKKIWTVFSSCENYGCNRGYLELRKGKIKGGILE